MNHLLEWPPQPSTVVGLGVLGATIAYFVTGNPVWAGVIGAGIKILVPDSTTRSNALDMADTIFAFVRPLLKSEDAVKRVNDLEDDLRHG